MKETLLRTVAPEEATAIERMARRIWPESYRRIISSEQIDYMLDWMYSPEKIAQEITEEGIRYFWIESEDEKVGFLSVGPVLPLARAFLHKCYVLFEKQGRGIGSEALESLVNFLSASSVSDLELRVNRHNSAAISFYEKNGFRAVAKDKADIGCGFEMDDFIMHRTI